MCQKRLWSLKTREYQIFEEAAGVPVAALTAYHGINRFGKIKPGSEVLINGASGGVGTFAVQLAKYYGANVTGVCSNRNIDLVKDCGAEDVLDYTETRCLGVRIENMI